MQHQPPDTHSRLEELREREARLSIGALSDQGAASELAAVVTARRAIEHAEELAPIERERCEREAAEKAEAKRIAAARAEAETLGQQLAAEAENMDDVAATFAAAVAAYGGIYQRRKEAQQAAGDRPWGQGGRPLGIGAALRFQLTSASALAFLDVRDGCPDRPLTAEANR